MGTDPLSPPFRTRILYPSVGVSRRLRGVALEKRLVHGFSSTQDESRQVSGSLRFFIEPY